MSSAIVSSSPSPEGEAALLPPKKPSRAYFYGKFVVEATNLSTGWRITTIDSTIGVQHNFYVREGQLYHINFHASPPWNHATPFVVGSKVRRITDSEMRAIRRAIG
jgi:hypothetical protein